MSTMASVITGAARRLARRAGPALFAAFLLAASWSLTACSSKSDPPTFPMPPAPEAQDWLFDVKGTAANDVYACGNKGAMFRFDGATWTAQPMGTSLPITAIWPDPATAATLYAVGHGGRIWRNAGGTWSSMDSGTTSDLYGIGSFGGAVHAVGRAGALRKLSGNTWSGAGGSMVLLDENGAPKDTLQVAEDIASLTTVNNFFLGGAYLDPEFTGRRVGTAGTRGMVLTANTDPLLQAPWILRQISGEQRVLDEWVLCMTSDPVNLGRNLMSTSEGWLFRLVRDDDGKNVWSKFNPSLTVNPGAGINDLWLDAAGNLYMVTDEGRLVWQSANYSFVDETGECRVLYDGTRRLTGLWASAPDNIYICGFMEEKILHVSHDPGTHAVAVTEIPLAFAGKAAAPAMGFDHIGRPLD